MNKSEFKKQFSMVRFHILMLIDILLAVKGEVFRFDATPVGII